MKRFLFLAFLILVFNSLPAQKQLVLLKGERVIVRYTEGQYLRCKLKNKQKKEGKLLALTDTQVITSNDTLSLLSIESVRIKSKESNSLLQKTGNVLMIAGIGYFTIDQLNNLIMEGHTQLDGNVWKTSIILTGVGAALYYIRSPYKKVYGRTLKVIDYSSRFYNLY